MAIIELYDGVDDYSELDSQIDMPNTGAYDIELICTIDEKPSTNNSNYVLYVTGNNSFQYNSSTEELIWKFSGSDVKLSALKADVYGQRLVIHLMQNAAGHHTFTVDGIGTSNTHTGLRVFSLLRLSAQNGFRFAGSFERMTITGALSHDWDVNASVHTAGTPIVTDTIGGNNFTGVNLPTAALGEPGSAWVDLGGEGISVTGLLNSNYMVEYSMKKNVAGQSIGAQMITISDGSNFTGTVTAEVTIDNGTKTAGGGAVTHEGEGYHSYAPTQAETNGDHVAVSFAGTGALSQTIQVYTTFPQSVDNNTAIAALNDFNPASDTVANVTLVATTTTNTDMRGTDSANTVVPASLAQFNARSLLSANYALEVSLQNVDTNVDSILVDTGTTIPTQITALNDFNPVSDTVANVTLVATTTTNTDMRGTDGANTVIPPTVTEFNARTLPSADYSQFDFAVNEVSADIAKVNGVTIIGAGTSGDLWRA